MHVMKREQSPPPRPRREVPEDIIVNVILPKLPTKSLLRFKSVNKSWKHWITSSEFVRLHLLNQSSLKSIHTDDDHVILTRRETLFSMPTQGSVAAAASNVDDPVEMEYPFKSPHHTVKVLGSCNGLVLLKIKEIPLHPVFEFLPPETGIWNPLYRGFRPPETCIWNPCTMEYIILPRVPKQSREYFHELGSGIGYDSSTDEYKVTTVLSNLSFKKVITIYKVKSNTWSEVVVVVPFPSFIPLGIRIFADNGIGFFANGTIHWLGYCNDANNFDPMRPKVLYYLHIESEEWGEVRLPDFEERFIAVKMGLAPSEEGGLAIYLTYENFRWFNEVWLCIDVLVVKKKKNNEGRSDVNSGWSFTRSALLRVEKKSIKRYGNYSLSWMQGVNYRRTLVSPRQLCEEVRCVEKSKLR